MINDNNNDFIYDFAISYAGEDKDIADNIVKSLKEIHNECNIFYAPEKYMELLSNLKDAIAVLAKKIEQKVYEYGFLMK